MEVGEHRVDHREPVSRPDEQIGLGAVRSGGCRRLQGPHHRGAYRHHPISIGAGGPGGLGDAVPLGVHLVVVEVVGGHRGEGGGAHGQFQRAHHSPRRPAAVQHRLGEVEPGGGGGGRHRAVGVDGLVALGVGQLLGDVGGKGHLAGHFHEDVGITDRLHLAPSVVAQSLPHLHHRLAVEPQLGARWHPAARTHQRVPPAVLARFQQQDLHPAPGGLVEPQPGGHDPAVVHHQHVAGGQQLGQVPGQAVLGRRGGTPIDQQPRAVPGLGRLLGDGGTTI